MGRNVAFFENSAEMDTFEKKKQRHQSSRTTFGYSMMFLNSFSSCDLSLPLKNRSPVASTVVNPISLDPWQEEVIDMT